MATWMTKHLSPSYHTLSPNLLLQLTSISLHTRHKLKTLLKSSPSQPAVADVGMISPHLHIMLLLMPNGSHTFQFVILSFGTGHASFMYPTLKINYFAILFLKTWQNTVRDSCISTNGQRTTSVLRTLQRTENFLKKPWKSGLCIDTSTLSRLQPIEKLPLYAK